MSQRSGFLDAPKPASPWQTIFWSGLAAGVLDGLAGVIVYYFWFGFTPVKVFQFVASALYGKQAYSGGSETTLIGFILHFVIGYACAIVYFLAYPKIKVLQTRVVTS